MQNAIRCCIGVLPAIALAVSAWADPPHATASPVTAPAVATIGVRLGNHRDFGRVVFDLPAGSHWRTAQNGAVLTIRFSGAARIAGEPDGTARNVRRIAGLPDGVELTLAPGAHARAWRLGHRLVVDVFDPAKAAEIAKASPPPVATRPPPAKAAALPRPTPIAPPPAPPAAVAATPPAPTPAPLQPVEAVTVGATATPPAAPPPLAIAARPAPAPAGSHAITLPFAAGTGAAAFRRGGDALVVFDAQRPVDLAPLRDDPAFAAAAITLLPAATLLRLPLPAGQALHLSRVPAGWTVTLSPSAAPLRPIRPRLEADGLLLPATAPGMVVSLPDPQTGGTLLVGTQTGAGDAMPAGRRAPQFALLPSWQGVVVAPSSDALRLRTARGGFVLSAAGHTGLALSAPTAAALAAEDASALSRRYDFPDLPLPGLMRRLQAAVDAAANTQPQARGAKRVAVGEALIALGMGAEARSVLHLAGAGDGRLADDPDRIGLSAIAAILAGQQPTAGINDPRLDGTDEIALWRALRLAQAGQRAAAAPVLAASYKLLLAYPAPLRARLLPLAAETMALGGEPKAAAALLAARKDDPSLLLARALLAETEGDSKTALTLYDRAASSRDRLVRARAGFRAVELRVADKQITPAKAADALDRQIYAWRGDGRELKLRQREAALRAQAGEPRRALALLRETARLFPNDAPAIHTQLVDIFAAAIAAERQHPLPPLQLVALADENPDLVPPGEPGRLLASHLADRLLALQLPDRALPVLQKLADSTPPGDARSTIGARLAEARMQQGDAKGALASLAATLGVGHMAPELLQRRTLLFARASAATGQLPQALHALQALDSAVADEARASLLEQAKQWPAARNALLAWTTRTVPAEGMLNPSQAAALLRLASAAAQAGDEALLAKLHRHDLPRLPPGHLADMFRLLTAGPVDAVADLGRAAQETQLASRIPDALKSLTSIANP
ncbi:MAG TPA: hypothetical protein VL154_14235 [Acetobacteraceae bacterium]|nr:hypothetical protein [Acetobacteraceae bacterium]